MIHSLGKALYFTILLILVKDDCYCGNSHSKSEYSNSIDLKQSIENDNFNVIVINRNCSGSSIGEPSIDIDSIFQEIEKNIALHRWTFIVFSETFFGNNPIMNGDTARTIIEKCNVFTGQYSKVLIHINFLHLFENQDRPAWLPEKGIDTEEIHSNRIECNGVKFESDTSKSDIFKYDAKKNNRISNYSLLIWNKQPIIFYRKSTYCNEANNLTVKYNKTLEKFQAGDCLYEFGNFQENKVDGLTDDHEAIANTLLSNNLFRTRICYDLNEMKDFTSTTRLLIINANEAPRLDGWKHKINKDMLCIEADPFRQNPAHQALQRSEKLKYPECSYTFFNRDGRFIPRHYVHSLNDVLPFYVYLGSNGFEVFSDD